MADADFDGFEAYEGRGYGRQGSAADRRVVSRLHPEGREWLRGPVHVNGRVLRGLAQHGGEVRSLAS